MALPPAAAKWSGFPKYNFVGGHNDPTQIPIEALTEAARELLGDPAALAQARAGAERARDELTWEAAAARHLELYRELA